MAYSIGSFIGALAAMFLLSRLALWLLKLLGDNERRIFVAHVATFAMAVLLAGFGFGDERGPRFLYAASVYAIPTLIWVGVDLLALKGRRTKTS